MLCIQGKREGLEKRERVEGDRYRNSERKKKIYRERGSERNEGDGWLPAGRNVWYVRGRQTGDR